MCLNESNSVEADIVHQNVLVLGARERTLERKLQVLLGRGDLESVCRDGVPEYTTELFVVLGTDGLAEDHVTVREDVHSATIIGRVARGWGPPEVELVRSANVQAIECLRKFNCIVGCREQYTADRY